MVYCIRCGNQLPNGTQVCPHCGTPIQGYPQSGNQPGQGQNHPQGQMRQPGQGQNYPQGQMNQPGQGQNYPQGQMNQPGQGQNYPQGQMRQPGQGQNYPQGQMRQPGQGQNYPQGQMRQPGQGQNYPQGQMRQPGQGQNYPQQNYPQGQMRQPGQGQNYPQGQIHQPGQGQSYPQGQMRQPGPQQNYPQGQMYSPNRYPNGQGYGGPEKKSHTGLIIGIISAVVVIAALVIVLFVWPGVLTNKEEEGTTALQGTEQDITEGPGTKTETPTEEKTEARSTEEKTEVKTEKKTEEKTEKKTEEKTEKPTEKPTEAKNGTSFEDYGMVTNLKLNKSAKLKTCSWDNPDAEVVATVTWTKYESEAVSDEVLAFGKENGFDLTGYERKRVELEMDFDATDNFDKYGAMVRPWIEDWYNVDLFEDSMEEFTDSYEENYYRAKIIVNGKEQFVYLWYDYDFDLQKRHMSQSFVALVPAGYDGVVVGISDARLPDTEDHIYKIYDKDKFLLLYMK